MSLLQIVLTDSFTVLARNFTLIYPVLFLYLLLPLIAPRDATPSLEGRWILLISMMLLIVFAFMAGWFYMIYKACRYYLSVDKPRQLRQAAEKSGETEKSGEDETPAVLHSFLLLREFFPGVGEYFVRFTLGGLINVGVMLGIYLLVKTGIDNMHLAPQLMERVHEVATGQTTTQAEVDQFIQTLGVEERRQLITITNYIFYGLIGYAVFSLLTMLWPPFVMIERRSVLDAYWQSILQFFRDPIRILALGTLFFSLNLLSTFALRIGDHVLLVSLWQFILILVQIYFSVALYLYIIHARGLPSEDTAEDTPPETAASA